MLHVAFAAYLLKLVVHVGVEHRCRSVAQLNSHSGGDSLAIGI